MKHKPNKEDYAPRNLLTVGIFGGAMVGFMVALCVGAINIKDGEKATDWIVAITSVVAALISCLAVILVSQTLKATRDTLEEAAEASATQKRLGILQSRAWLAFDACEVKELHRTGFIELIPCIRNYGSTPASNVKFSIQILRMQPPNAFLTEDVVHIELPKLPPTKGLSGSSGLIEPFDRMVVLVKLEWSYYTMWEEEDNDNLFLILTDLDGKAHAEPLTYSDFYKISLEFDCDARTWIEHHLQENFIEANCQFKA